MTLRVVLATGNAGKLREFGELLRGSGLTVQAQSDFDVPAVAETGLTFIENALIKARAAAAHSGLPALADDSGLAVDALDGAPGIYSARYAGAGASDADNVAQLLRALHGVPQARRTARFECVIVYLRDAADPTPIVAQGRWPGRILEAPRGGNGFGYDPVFFVPTHGCAAAELAGDEKNRLSHRGQAMRALLSALSGLERDP